ncbi:MAG TPA: hypothetical protein VLM42_16625 [Bryobacteraceae bacterium]|nr:hypothetical protein [Bryobacteraceae bacterium]
MSAKVFWIILAGLAILGIALIRYHAGTNPQNIDPHAAEEIEKAKRR